MRDVTSGKLFRIQRNAWFTFDTCSWFHVQVDSDPEVESRSVLQSSDLNCTRWCG